MPSTITLTDFASRSFSRTTTRFCEIILRTRNSDLSSRRISQRRRRAFETRAGTVRVLPEFMRTYARLENDVQAIDLARFERALADAFDAADGPRLSIDVLAAVSAEGWPSISFKFHPSCELLDLAVGTAALYEAVRDGQDLPLIDEEEEHILFWRSSDHQSCYRLVSPDERLALIEASAGKSFAEICSLLQFQGSGENVAARAGEFLTQWFAAGIISCLALDD